MVQQTHNEMEIFIFQDLDCVSSNYHEDGGAIVIAKDKDRAIELIDKHETLKVSDDEWLNCVESYPIITTDEQIIIFPDAGCC